MPLVPLCRLLTLCACFMLAAPAWGAEEQSAPASSPQVGSVADARALIDVGRFVDALAVLGPLLEANAVEANALFLYGLAAIGAARGPDVPDDTREALLDEAIAAFRTMLIADPGLVRVRLELARAFLLKGEDTLATRHFEQVLAGKPPASVVLNVNRFLSQMRARKRWSVRLGMALAPDSNISSRSDERTIVLDTPIDGFRLPFRRRTSPNPVSASRSGPAGNTSTRWRTAGSCARAPTSRAGTTARASSTK